MKQGFGNDLTQGSIARHLLGMAWPMLVGNLLNTGYSIVNAIWLGKAVGKDAVGAVGVSFPVIFILIAIAAGGTMATSILVAQAFGAREEERVRATVRTSVTCALVAGVVMAVCVLPFADHILALLKTPTEIFPLASSYLRITIFGFPVMFLSFLVTSVLRGIGDTRTPLLFMAAGVAANAVLDPLLILGVGPLPALGIDGAAWASVFSSLLALVSGIIYLNSKGHLVAINHRSLGWNSEIALRILRIGFPSMVQMSLINLSAAMVTRFVNGFGPDAASAFGAGARVDSLAFMPAMSVGLAVSAVAGQNIGAKRLDRVTEVFRWGVIMTTVVTLLISAVVLIFPREVMGIFINESEVVELGVGYLRIVGGGYIFFAIMFVSNGIINGAGHTLVTMIFSVVSLWLVRVPLAAWWSSHGMGLHGIWWAMVASFFVTMVVSLGYYRSGRWRKAKRAVQEVG